jgi:hypothetical protein
LDLQGRYGSPYRPFSCPPVRAPAGAVKDRDRRSFSAEAKAALKRAAGVDQ